MKKLMIGHVLNFSTTIEKESTFGVSLGIKVVNTVVLNYISIFSVLDKEISITIVLK